MASSVGEKRTHEAAFPSDTSPSSPAKRRREDATQDVASPHLSVSSETESQQSLNTRTVQLLSPSTLSESQDLTREDTSPLLTDSSELKVHTPPRNIKPLPILMKNPAELSIVDRLLRRELGMPHQLSDPISWQKKGEDLFDQDKFQEALQSFKMAETCYELKKIPEPPELIEIIAKTQYELQQYSDSLKTWKLLADQSPINLPQAILMSSLCQLKQGDWESFSQLVYSFYETWTLWLTILPSRSPLSQEHVDIYRRRICFDVINELEKIDAEGDSKTKIRVAIFYISCAMNYYDSAFTYAKLLRSDRPELRTYLQMNFDLKRGSAEDKEMIYEFLENNFSTIEQDEMETEENRFDVPWHMTKLVFNEGLRHRNPRPLILASNYLLEIFKHGENGPDENLFLLNHLFFCTFSLGRYDQAIECASKMEELDPGVARAQQALCSLAKGEALNKDLLSNLTQAIEKKNSWIADPTILTFISDNLRGYKQDELDKVADRFQEWAGSFIRE